MKCVMCDNKARLKPRKINLKYKECGLENVTIHGATVYRCNRCGEEYVNLGDLDKLHQAIAQLLLTKKGLLSGKEVRFLRTSLGYSTQVFAKLTGYDPATLSRIENAKQSVSPSFNVLVRALAANKLPDRRYDLHELWIKKAGAALNHIQLTASGRTWKVARDAA